MCYKQDSLFHCCMQDSACVFGSNVTLKYGILPAATQDSTVWALPPTIILQRRAVTHDLHPPTIMIHTNTVLVRTDEVKILYCLQNSHIAENTM